jgi:hypothetical protein
MSVSFSGVKALAVGSSVYVPMSDAPNARWLQATVDTLDGATARLTYADADASLSREVPVSRLIKRDAWVRLTYPTADDYGNDDRDFNLSNMNARAFLQFLQVPCANDEDGLSGSLPIGDMLRLIQKAQASADYRVDALCRESFDTQGTRGPRIISQGIDEAYFTRQLATFAEYVTDLSLAGAAEVSWG